MKHARHTFASLLPRSDLKIGPRLTVCFLAIVVLMIAADAVVIWQVHQLAAQTQVLNAADKASSAIVRLHLDVNSFSGRVTALTRSHDSRQFASEAASVTRDVSAASSRRRASAQFVARNRERAV